MRATPAALLASCVLGAVSAACVDLFHSTKEIDAAACPPPPSVPDASPGGDACSGDPADAAAHACAWLGACESPTGENAFGPCMFHAMLALDCAANPNHRVVDSAGTWACLATATSCTAVERCIFPSGAPACAGTAAHVACGTGSSAGVRVVCGAGNTMTAEPCALWGETCVATDGGAYCGGTGAGLSCADGGATGSCDGTWLHWCGPGGSDIGLDCAATGRRCEAVRDSWIACVAPDVPGGCTPTLGVACSDGGVAQSCPTGAVESIDCAALLGSPAACSGGTLDPPFDWTSPCRVPNAACANDECDGGTVYSCVRGATRSVDCTRIPGLSGCTLVTSDLDGAQRAVCTHTP